MRREKWFPLCRYRRKTCTRMYYSHNNGLLSHVSSPGLSVNGIYQTLLHRTLVLLEITMTLHMPLLHPHQESGHNLRLLKLVRILALLEPHHCGLDPPINPLRTLRQHILASGIALVHRYRVRSPNEHR